MALEASGATVVPVGVGQSRRLLDLIPRLGLTAIYGTLSFPAHLAGRAREAGIDPATLGLRHIVTAGEPGAGLGAVRAQIEATWDASVADSFGMSDVWSTMAGECEARQGLHLTTEGWAVLELSSPEPRRRWRSRTTRTASSCGPTCAARPRRCCATARAISRACGRRRAPAGARRADPHRGPRRRHAARAGGQRAPRRDRRGARALRGAGPLRGGGRGRPDRPAAARPRRDGERGRGRGRGPARRAGCALRGAGGGAGGAAGGRAEDARRVPHGARRGVELA